MAVLRVFLVDAEGLIIFVDGVVGEMGVGVGEVEGGGLLEGLGGESGQALFIDVDSEGRDASDQDIDPQVELEAVDEEGVHDVLLDDLVGLPFQLHRSIHQINSSPLAPIVRLYDVHLPLPVLLHYLVVVHR